LSQLNAEQINYTKIGNDAGVAPRIVRVYFQSFSDTMSALLVRRFQKTSKRKAVATDKFYLIDLGVACSLVRTGDVAFGIPAFGKALDTLFFGTDRLPGLQLEGKHLSLLATPIENRG
jgi:uncharacterized protein